MNTAYGRLVLLLISSLSLFASDLIEASPISDRIIALHFVDGSVQRHTRGQRLTDDITRNIPLRTASLTSGGFTIASVKDGAYAPARSALTLHRKSKGLDFAFTASNWRNPGPDGNAGFYPSPPTWALEHWVYLTLPSAMRSGADYTISWDATALNTAVGSVSYRFVENEVRSEAIHVNTIGYVDRAPKKFGYLYYWAGNMGGVDYTAWSGKPFRLVQTGDGRTAFTGLLAFRKPATNAESAYPEDSPNGNFLGAAVWECDFSGFSTPGTYRLVIDGIGCSYPFVIGADVYQSPFHAVMKGLVQNRSGIPLELPWADEARPAPHNTRLTPGFAGRLRYSSFRWIDMENLDGGSTADKASLEAGEKGGLEATWGWYQDAGDWDSYFRHGQIPIGLLVTYLAKPTAFYDGQLAVPESANGIPDIIDEASWMLRFQQRLRQELLAKRWGTGGIGARVFGDLWGSDLVDNVNNGSWGDVDRNWYVTGEDPFASYRYAAGAALLAETYARLGRGDPAGVDWGTEAEQVFAWAEANTRAGDEGKDLGLEGKLSDHRALAAVCLYRLTGSSGYHSRFLADSGGWGGELSGHRQYAVALYLTMPSGKAVDAARSTALRASLTSDTLYWYRTAAERRGLRWGGHWFVPSGVGRNSSPSLLPALMATFSARAADQPLVDELAAMMGNTADYFLGNNALHTTWVTGLGPRPPTGVFSLDDWACGSAPRTGLTPFGPCRLGNQWFWWPLHIPASPTWAYQTTYPQILNGASASSLLGDGIGTWPLDEAWFQLATSPQAAEFTVDMLLNPAMLYAFLLPAKAPPVISEGTTVRVNMSKNGSPSPFDLSLHAVDTTPATLTWSVITSAAHGLASAAGTGISKRITYTPVRNWIGEDTFVVQVCDGTQAARINVHVTVQDVPSPLAAPVITEGSTATVTMSEDGTPTAFALTLHATDADSTTLTWSINSAADHGTATASGTGLSKAISYTPNADWNGSDAFTVLVSDGAQTDTIAVTVTIQAINDPPVNTVMPVVSGATSVGSTLSATSGTWSDSKDAALSGASALSYTYQWLRARSASGTGATPIGNATGSLYTLVADDLGVWIGCQITCTNTGIGLPSVVYADVQSLWVGPVATSVTGTFSKPADGCGVGGVLGFLVLGIGFCLTKRSRTW